MKDLYEILGVERTATKLEIRRAFRRLAKTVHPDAGGGVEAFQDLNLAHMILTDDDKRERYDAGEDVTKEASSEFRKMMIYLTVVLDEWLGRDDWEYVNPLNHMSAATAQRLQACRANIKTVKRQIERLDKIAAGFETDGKTPNHLSSLVRAKATGERDMLKTMEQGVETLTRAEEFLKVYRFTGTKVRDNPGMAAMMAAYTPCPAPPRFPFGPAG